MPDDDRGTPTIYGSLAAEEAFALVGNEVRADILRALSDARRGEGDPPVLTFSELRSRVDADADSSQFNYHLQQLVGILVERRDDVSAQLIEHGSEQADEGYALRPEGTTLARTIRAGAVDDGTVLDAFDAGIECYFCGTSTEATYGNSVFKIQCPRCEYLYEYDIVPPGVIGGDEGVVVSRAGEYLRHRRLAFARGVCPLCANGLSTEFVDPGETEYPRPDRRRVVVNRWCDHCGHRNYLRVGEALLRDAGLICFCRRRGLDVTSTPIWRIGFAATDRHTVVRSRRPWEVALRVVLDGDTLELAVDGDLSIVERNRT